MDNQLVPLQRIFRDSIFRVPDYQRGYAWTEKEIKDFWNDIQQIEGEQSHYTGVLTLEIAREREYRQWHDDVWIIDTKGYTPYLVVDGQQRLTTAIILIKCILNRMADGAQIIFTGKAEIEKRFIYESKGSAISRSYLFGYTGDVPSNIYLKTKVFGERAYGSVEENTYTENLHNAMRFFEARLEALSLDDVGSVFKKLTQNMLFNLFLISRDVDVHVAFETMNNRGKRLSYLELLKNRLIFLSLRIEIAEHQMREREKLRRDINDCWRTLYYYLGKNKENPLDDDRFLYTHYAVYFGEDALLSRGVFPRGPHYRTHTPRYVEALLEEIFVTKNISHQAPERSRLDLGKIYSYVHSLRGSVVTWYYLFNPDDSPYTDDVKIYLTKLNQIWTLGRGGMDKYPLLVLIFLQNVEDQNRRVAFLSVLEKVAFVSGILGVFDPAFDRETSRSRISELASRLKVGEDVSGKIITMLERSTSRAVAQGSPYFEEAFGRFVRRGYYEWPLIRYFLFEYEMHLQSESKTYRQKIFWAEFTEEKDDYVSVEHIFPKDAKDEYWVKRFGHLTDRQRKALLDSLGNLLPLSKSKNSSLSNNAFPEKVEGKSGSYAGYRYGSYSENEVALVPEWNPDAILKRGLKMLDFMEQRWGIQLGDQAWKTKILGLSFLLGKPSEGTDDVDQNAAAASA